jgi:B9 domain-containing protein 1
MADTNSSGAQSLVIAIGDSPLHSTNSHHLRLKTRSSGHLGLKLKQNDSIVAGNEPASSFFLMITGQIECAHTSSTLLVNNQLYCRYTFSYGPDWIVSHGVTSGITQIAGSRRAMSGNYSDQEGKGSVNVWNFPIEISFQSTNTYGWPRLCLSVYGIDFLGRDVVRGYASILLPINPGRYTKLVKTFRPESGTAMQQFISWLTGTNPEFLDSKITATGEGRELTRVVNENDLKLKIHLLITRKEFASFGYTSSS